MKCGTPTKVRVNYHDPAGTSGPIICMAPGVRIHLGHNDGIPTGTPGDMTAPEYGAAQEFGYCGNEEYEDPIPRDRLVGIAEVKRHEGTSPMRPFAGAKWEMWYKGKGGAASDPVTWRPVLKTWNQDTWAPSGQPLTGFLSASGEFDDQFGSMGIDFLYPQTRPLSNGTTWHGCETPDPSVPHLKGKACRDEDLVLRISPINSDSTIKVSEPGAQGEVSTSDVIKVGEHFRPEHAKKHTLTSPASAAYGGILNVRDLAERASVDLPAAVVALNNDGLNRMSNITGGIDIDTEYARSSAVEHEGGHLLMRAIEGNGGLDCIEHSFTAAENEECAWSEGWADFVSVLAENEPGSTAWTKMTSPISSSDLEKCAITFLNDGSPTEPYGCDDGPAVEGNVAAFLFDLVDDNRPSEPNMGDLEVKAAFTDYSTSEFWQIVSVAFQAQADTFSDFWGQWVNSQSGDTREVETAWLNTLQIHGVKEESLVGSTGGWASETCANPESCIEEDFAVSESASASIKWDITSLFDESSATAQWDIWAKVPAAANLDPNARYTIDVAGNVQTFIVDQSQSQGNWVRLNSLSGIQVGPNSSSVTVQLSKGTAPSSEGTTLGTDGIVITPRV